MNNIPSRLEGCTFLLLRKNLKTPYAEFKGDSWHTHKIGDKELDTWNQNIGFICGTGGIRVIDIEGKSKGNIYLDELVKKLDTLKTFKVSTPSGGFHYYIKNEENFTKSYAIIKIDSVDCGEFRAKDCYVVAPNSVVNNKKYEVVDNFEIKEIKIPDLDQLIKIKDSEKKEIPKTEKMADGTRSGKEFGATIQLIKKGLSKEEVFKEMELYAKWSSGHEQYKEKTYTKAFEIVEKEIKKKESKFKIKNALGFFTDYLEMADKFIEMQPMFYTNKKIWWLWNFENVCWEMVDEIDLLNQIAELTQGMRVFESKTKTEVINSLKMRGRLNTPKEAKKSWIQFKGMIHDIETGEEFEATPEYFVTNPIPWELGETEETPEMDKLFSEWVTKEESETLFEILAYSLLPDYPLHRVFCLNGEGRNGKGSFLKILTKLIGERNLCTTDLDTLINRPFEAAKLYKKLVCQMGEINSGIFKRTSLFKKLTGADSIGYEFKGKDGFDDYNYAKMIIATNKLPESTDKTVGFYSRWRIIDFNNRFKENTKLMNRIPKEEYNNLARKCLRHLKLILERGEFTGDGEIEERMKRYEDRASPIREFLKNNCTEEERYQVPFYKLYDEYLSYLDRRGFRKASKRELSNLIKARGFDSKRVHFTKSDGTDGTMHVVIGLGLQNELEECEAEAEHRSEAGTLKY